MPSHIVQWRLHTMTEHHHSQRQGHLLHGRCSMTVNYRGRDTGSSFRCLHTCIHTHTIEPRYIHTNDTTELWWSTQMKKMSKPTLLMMVTTCLSIERHSTTREGGEGIGRIVVDNRELVIELDLLGHSTHSKQIGVLVELTTVFIYFLSLHRVCSVSLPSFIWQANKAFLVVPIAL